MVSYFRCTSTFPPGKPYDFYHSLCNNVSFSFSVLLSRPSLASNTFSQSVSISLSRSIKSTRFLPANLFPTRRYSTVSPSVYPFLRLSRTLVVLFPQATSLKSWLDFCPRIGSRCVTPPILSLSLSLFVAFSVFLALSTRSDRLDFHSRICFRYDTDAEACNGVGCGGCSYDVVMRRYRPATGHYAFTTLSCNCRARELLRARTARKRSP